MRKRFGELVIVTALLLFGLLGDIRAEAGDFVADMKSGCKVWNPHPQDGETAEWSGACVNGLAQGKGILQWLSRNKPSEKDEGEWIEGRQSGRGSQDWNSGRYDGDLVNGEPEGRGVLALRVARYEGQFHNGKPNGAGTVTSLEGVVSGTWKDGCLVDDKRRVSFAVPSSACRLASDPVPTATRKSTL